MVSDWREERNEIVDYIKNTLPQKLQNDQGKVDNKLQDNGINKNRIEVIVISAFYSKDFEKRRQALEKIGSLRKISLK